MREVCSDYLWVAVCDSPPPPLSEAALLTCRYYLRNTRSYTLSATLPDLGSRVAKYWYLVTPTGQGSSSRSKMILTLLPVAKQCPIALQKENLNLLNELFATLKVQVDLKVHRLIICCTLTSAPLPVFCGTCGLPSQPVLGCHGDHFFPSRITQRYDL